MENKRYLDKVIEHLVRGIKIDYEKEQIRIPFYPIDHPFSLKPSHPFGLFDLLSSPFFSVTFHYKFENYCKNHFGLTKEEIKYVWKEYLKNIDEKINAPA